MGERYACENGLLIVGHGTRSKRGQQEFLELAEQAGAKLPHTLVRACFLELAEPTIASAVQDLVHSGIKSIVAMPLLLLAAGHAKDDIPAALHAAAQQHGGGEILLAPHLGCDRQLLELSAARFAAEAAKDPEISLDDTAWLLVGRGNRDLEAQAELQQFAALRQEVLPSREARLAYLAMAEPRLDDAIEALLAQPVRRVIVQPHLLFHGELLEKLTARVQRAAERAPRQVWRITPHLGPADAVAEIVARRYFSTVSAG